MKSAAPHCRRAVLALAALLLAAPGTLFAQNTIRMKNGTVVEGYITVQRPGKDMKVKSHSAILTVNSDEVQTRREYTVRFEDLSREWKRWALENWGRKKLKFTGNKYEGLYVNFYEIRTKNLNLPQVARLYPEDAAAGTETYLQYGEDEYQVPADGIAEIRKAVPSPDRKLGVDDRVVTRSGQTYTGTIILSKPGESLTVQTPNGQVTVSESDVRELHSLPRLEGIPLFDQADYRNVVVMKDGDTVEGVITLKSSEAPATVTVSQEVDSYSIQASQIAEYRTNYIEKDKAVYGEGRVYVNEFLQKQAVGRRSNGTTVLNTDKVFVFPEGLSVTFKAGGSKFYDSEWRLILLEDVSVPGQQPVYGYREATEQSMKPEDSNILFTDGVSSITFGYLAPGYYALSDAGHSEMYLFRIK